MGGLTAPATIQLGSTPGEASGPGIGTTNRELYGANVAANWTVVGAGTLVLAAAWENGFTPGLFTSAAAGDYATGALCDTYNTVSVPAKATDRINTLSCYVLTPTAGVPSPRCRLQFDLTAGPTYSIDFDPRSGILIAQAGNPINPRVERIVLPMYDRTENVSIYRVSFAFNSGGIATGTPRFYPRTDGAAIGAVIYGGSQLEGMVSSPTAFIPPAIVGAGTRLAGQAPRQITTPLFQEKLIQLTPYVVSAYADQDTWLHCDLLAGNAISLPVVAGNFPDMPTGSRLLVTQSPTAIGGITSITGAANAIIAPGGVSSPFTTVTFPSTDFPNVTQMLLIKTAVQNQWMIIGTAAGGSSMGLFLQAGAGAVARTFQDKDRDIYSVKDYGAKGDNATDDGPVINALIAYVSANGGGTVVFPHVPIAYVSAIPIILQANVELKGENWPLLKFTNAASGGDLSVTGGNSAIREMRIQIAAIQCIYFGAAVTRFALENNYLIDAGLHTGIMFHVDTANTFDILVRGNIIDGGNYGVLVNQNATGGRLIIDANVMRNNKCININTLAAFSDVVISNNILDASNNPGGFDDFAVDIAQGKKVIIANNRIIDSKLEAIHIEDAAIDVIVNGNDVTTTNSDGIQIVQVAGGGSKNHIVSNNLFKFVGVPVAQIGINLVTNANGSVSDITVANNKVVNFATGASLGATFDNRAGAGGSGLFHHNTIDTCAKGIVATIISEQVRDNLMHTVTQAYQLTFGGTVGNTIFTGTMPVTLATNANGIFTMKGLKFSVPVWAHAGGIQQYVNIVPAPTAYLGDALTYINDAAFANVATYTENFTFTGGVDTTNTFAQLLIGAVATPDIRINAGQLQVGIFAAAPTNFNTELTLYGAFTL